MSESKLPIKATSLANTEPNLSIKPLRCFGQIAILLFAMLLLANKKQAHADSAIDLVAGFDAERIAKVFPIDKQSIGEAAKLLYRIKKVRPESFSQRIEADNIGVGEGDGEGDGEDATDYGIGDAVQFEGAFVSSTAFAIPDSLNELLGFKSISMLSIDTVQGKRVRVIASSVPVGCKPGDQFNVIGMVAKAGEDRNVIEAVVAAKMSWFPRVAANASWQWLADRGVDISTLVGLKTRDRRPLTSADSDAFYSIMATASKSPWPQPVTVKPIELLSDPNSLVANFITLPVEIIQVTRVSVTDAARQRQLGRDHYFQVDTIGDLGNVVVKIEPTKDHPEDKPAIFEDRYPVSIVMLELPEFLKTKIRAHEGGEAVVSDVRAQVQVDGFFFRLWSYETDFMKQFGDEKQFGPLLVAARLQNLETDSPDPLGVNVIGWIAAGLIGLSMIAVFIWHRFTSAADAKIRRNRRDKSATEIDLSS